MPRLHSIDVCYFDMGSVYNKTLAVTTLLFLWFAYHEAK